jgi:hypothetical protein
MTCELDCAAGVRRISVRADLPREFIVERRAADHHFDLTAQPSFFERDDSIENLLQDSVHLLLLLRLLVGYHLL